MKNQAGAAVIAVVNQKGGVGKTTTAVNVSALLAESGKRILLIDCDPQANATSGLGVDKASLESSLYDVLVDESTLQSIIIKGVAGIPNLDLAPSSLDLSGAELALYSQQNLSRESVLKRALKPILREYDAILIDAPPSLGLLTINILTAVQSLIIPIQCEYYALEGISQLLTIIDHVKNGLNKDLKIGMVVLTMQDSRTNLSQQVSQEVQQFFGEAVAKTTIPRNIRLSEAPSFGQPISRYDSKSKGACAYLELSKEILGLL